MYLLKPTYDDLLAKGYIKLAKALKEIFHNQLSLAFGDSHILVAPIKELQRCKAKLEEYMRSGVSSPYAAWVCDYLRATVLCSSLQGMVEALHTLTGVFKVVRIKQRIGPNSPGNKVILVNVIVADEGKTIKPNKYPWSDWWDNQPVCMIAEVFCDSICCDTSCYYSSCCDSSC